MPWIIVCSMSVASSCSINLRSTDGPSLPPFSMVGFSTLVTPLTFSARSSRRLLLPVYFCHNCNELASRCSWQLLALSPSCHVHVYVILFAGWSDMLILDTAFGKLAVGHAFYCSRFTLYQMGRVLHKWLSIPPLICIQVPFPTPAWKHRHCCWVSVWLHHGTLVIDVVHLLHIYYTIVVGLLAWAYVWSPCWQAPRTGEPQCCTMFYCLSYTPRKSFNHIESFL